MFGGLTNSAQMTFNLFKLTPCQPIHSSDETFFRELSLLRQKTAPKQLQETHR